MRVLLCEDDEDTARLVSRGLVELGHEVVRVPDGESALRRGAGEPFDVVILDRMLPELDGTKVVERWRAAGVSTPVLMLTALGGIMDRVGGLEAGADDYLVKPFAFPELAARLSALARRPPLSDSPTRLSAAGIEMDLIKREVRRDGREIHLQPREFAILEQLLRHVGKVVTRSMFLEIVWGFHFDPQTNIVESHLSRLRSKINEGFACDPIQTLRGVGYRLRGDD